MWIVDSKINSFSKPVYLISYCQSVGILAMKTEATTAPAGLTVKQIAAVREAFAYFDRLDF